MQLMKIQFCYAITILLICCSCQSNMENELIVGKWKLMKFAYSVNNQTIANETLILNEEKDSNADAYCVYISPDEKNLEFGTSSMVVEWFPIYFYYSIEGSSMEFLEIRNPSYIYRMYTDTGNDILHALNNTQKYVIKGNEMSIYFTGLKGKNVLILKKIK